MTNKEISIKHTHTHKLPGEPVSGAGDDMKKLRQGVDKVDHLRDEEQQHHLAEVSQDANHSKCHPSKIAESVSHKHRWGVPAARQVLILNVNHICKCTLKKGHHFQLTSCGKTVLNWWRRTVSWSKGRTRGHCGNPLMDDTTNYRSDIKWTHFWRIHTVVFSHLHAYTRCSCSEVLTPTAELQHIEDDDGAWDKKSLARFDPIDACEDVDGVCAEHCQHSHVDIVENAYRVNRHFLQNDSTVYSFFLHLPSNLWNKIKLNFTW